MFDRKYEGSREWRHLFSRFQKLVREPEPQVQQTEMTQAETKQVRSERASMVSVKSDNDEIFSAIDRFWTFNGREQTVPGEETETDYINLLVTFGGYLKTIDS